MNKRLILLLILLMAGVTTAQRPDAPEYALRGPYTVGTRDYVIEDAERPLDVSIWYPADTTEAEITQYTMGLITIQGEAVRDAPPLMGEMPYPLVLFSHGSSGFRFQSLWLVEHLASYGFVVMATDHPTNTIMDVAANSDQFALDIPPNYIYRPQDMLRTIDLAETLNADDMAGIIDTENIAISGHSFGGYTALAIGGARLNFDQLAEECNTSTEAPELLYNVCFMVDTEDALAEIAGYDSAPDGAWDAISDPRIKAVIALAPWNGTILDDATLNSSTVPTLIMVGSTDSVTPPQRDAYIIYDELISAPRTLVSFANGDHYIFVDECFDLAIRMGFFSSCSDAVWDMSRVHDISNHVATAFLLDVFYGDADAQTALNPANNDYPGVYYDRQDALPFSVLHPQVLETLPHDPNAFTQGLLLHDGLLYESTGLYGQSTLRNVDPATGDVGMMVTVDDAYFAEGLTLVDDRLIQITWRENTAFIYDVTTFEFLGEYTYEGEGWGLCYDDEWIYMSSGSSDLTRRDPQTFELLETIPVTLDGQPVYNINELECVGDDIYANIWQTNQIVRIDKHTGNINAVIDATGLLSPEEYAAANVLNGIAYDAENDWFYITGKLWGKMFIVRFE